MRLRAASRFAVRHDLPPLFNDAGSWPAASLSSQAARQTSPPAAVRASSAGKYPASRAGCYPALCPP